MGNNTIIYVTDDRQRYLAHFLRGKKRQIEKLEDINMAEVGRVILPTPFTRLRLNQNEYEQMKYELSKYQPKIYGGVFPKDWNVPKTLDFMQDETVVMENARITAEAVVSEIIANSIYGIKNEKILVTGFVKCGERDCQTPACHGGKGYSACQKQGSAH